VIGPQERPAREGEAGRTGIDLINSSDQPVYRLVVGIVFIQGAGPETIEAMIEYSEQNVRRAIPVTTASVLPPRGTFRVWVAGVGWSSILAGRSGAEVAFTDRAGSHWILRATGRLEEIAQEPFEHFARSGLRGPYELQTPERVTEP
jgi:hypothetical protein